MGVLMTGAADDPESPRRILALGQGLQEFGWTEGRNLRIDIRWAAGDPERYRRYASELIALGPDVVLASGGSTVAALQQVSRSVPIVFVGVTDPVGFGLVRSFARPGGNATWICRFRLRLQREMGGAAERD
jgi:putative ABC transport system substrate-binding protein